MGPLNSPDTSDHSSARVLSKSDLTDSEAHISKAKIPS